MKAGVESMLPLLVALLLIVAREARSAHRRSRLNRALHEARRPLQEIALSMPAGPGRMTPALPVWQAIRALGEVDRQVNGGPPDRIRPEPVACRLMTEACVRRWQSRARMAGGGIELNWTGPEALGTGGPAALSAAPDARRPRRRDAGADHDDARTRHHAQRPGRSSSRSRATTIRPKHNPQKAGNHWEFP